MINPFGKLNLERLKFYDKNRPKHNELLFQRLGRIGDITQVKLAIETPGSRTFVVTSASGKSYQTVVGKSEVRAYCSCDDFQNNFRRACEYSTDGVMPCKHILKAMCIMKSMKLLTFLRQYLFEDENTN